ncbi:MAG: GNAT family N-acetyltransferase [Rhodobacteraceae bacterium]|jgi:RimJ/RimL family protein N-acetyltransferase|nr:GNAT family N-acetyltransferase [Paracoccaceae bacterium]
MLQLAGPQDQDLIARLWQAPEQAPWIEPPDEGKIAAAISRGQAFLWCRDAGIAGFAVIMSWVPRVYGLAALVSTVRGQGEPLLLALLAQVFGPLDGHRIGLDVTADNARAIALYERLGFRHEGLIRECWQRPTGGWVDCCLMGLLAREARAPLARQVAAS